MSTEWTMCAGEGCAVQVCLWSQQHSLRWVDPGQHTRTGCNYPCRWLHSLNCIQSPVLSWHWARGRGGEREGGWGESHNCHWNQESPPHFLHPMLTSFSAWGKKTNKLSNRWVTYLFVSKDKENSIPQLILCHHARQLIPCFCHSLPVIAIHYKDQTCTHNSTFCLLGLFDICVSSTISTLMPAYKICTWMDGYQNRYEWVQTNRTYTWCQVTKCAKHFPYTQQSKKKKKILVKPVLNCANVCSLNTLRTVRWTICFLIELLVRRTWFRQFDELYSILNWLVMRCKLRPELAADSMI